MAKKKVIKKRGVKLGTKMGGYKKYKPMTLKDYNVRILKPMLDEQFLKVSENEMPFTSAPLTLCGQLEDAVMNLETRISNVIAKINSLM